MNSGIEEGLAGERTLFVFSDPGGARPLLALIATEPSGDFLVVSDREYSFYSDFGIPVSKEQVNEEELISRFRPTLVFTATSYTSDIERRYRRAASAAHIRTIAFVDHRTNISARFREGNELLLPDSIWVTDSAAKDIAINEGIPEGIVYVSGNPYHLWLKQWTAPVGKKVFLELAGLPPASNYILYAPDPLSNSTTDFGFDEISATRLFAGVVQAEADWPDNLLIAFKPHPNQPMDQLPHLLAGTTRFRILPAATDSNTAICHAELVIGFFSSLLIEASILGKPVLRYLPADVPDPLEGSGTGTVIHSFEELKKIVTRFE